MKAHELTNKVFWPNTIDNFKRWYKLFITINDCKNKTETILDNDLKFNYK